MTSLVYTIMKSHLYSIHFLYNSAEAIPKHIVNLILLDASSCFLPEFL